MAKKSTKAKSARRTTNTVLTVCWHIIEMTLAVMLLYIGITQGYSFGHAIFSGEGVENAPGRDYTFVIEEGDSVSKVADGLKELGLIEDTLVFRIQQVIYKYNIYPGTYTLNTSMSSREMLILFNAEPVEAETEASQ